MNPVQTFIPVAAVSDMLLHPGEQFDYNGRTLTYPDIKCVYWAGGNPFHHHQNLPRLRRALARVDTVVVHDPYWTAMAKHADIVRAVDHQLRARRLLGFAQRSAAGGDARAGRAVRGLHATTTRRLAALAERLGFGEQFTEGRTARQWLEHMYEKWSAGLDFEVPTFDEFWARGQLRLPTEPGLTLLADFRADPEAHRLATPSGRIEIFSDDDRRLRLRRLRGPSDVVRARRVAGRPTRGAAIRCTCWPISPPRDCTVNSTAAPPACDSKVQGREPIRMHPADAARAWPGRR